MSVHRPWQAPNRRRACVEHSVTTKSLLLPKRPPQWKSTLPALYRDQEMSDAGCSLCLPTILKYHRDGFYRIVINLTGYNFLSGPSPLYFQKSDDKFNLQKIWVIGDTQMSCTDTLGHTIWNLKALRGMSWSTDLSIPLTETPNATEVPIGYRLNLGLPATNSFSTVKKCL